MKAKDLMIGDLINGFGVVRRVTGIHGLERPEDEGLLTTMVPGCEFPESNLSFRPCYARPIPLTAEILEKNGFDMDDYTVHFKEDEHYMLELVFEDDELKWTINCNEYTIMNFEYVHELQHALRLCGIEKEIIL